MNCPAQFKVSNCPGPGCESSDGIPADILWMRVNPTNAWWRWKTAWQRFHRNPLPTLRRLADSIALRIDDVGVVQIYQLVGVVWILACENDDPCGGSPKPRLFTALGRNFPNGLITEYDTPPPEPCFVQKTCDQNRGLHSGSVLLQVCFFRWVCTTRIRTEPLQRRTVRAGERSPRLSS